MLFVFTNKKINGCFKIFTIEYIICLILIGIIAGFFSGMFGIGGGFLLVPFQFFLLESSGINEDKALLISFGTSLAIIVPTAISGAYKHNKNLENILNLGVKLGTWGIIGGFIGGIVASISNPSILEIIFGFVLLFIAIYNISFTNHSIAYKIQLNKALIIITGLIIGFLSGLLGIGGGVFLIIILNIFLGISINRSIGISSIFISFTAIGGVLSYIITGIGVNILPYSIGYINLIHLLIISLFSVPFAYIGAKLSKNIDEKKLKIAFSLLILIISLKMIGILP